MCDGIRGYISKRYRIWIGPHTERAGALEDAPYPAIHGSNWKGDDPSQGTACGKNADTPEMLIPEHNGVRAP